MNFLGWNCRGLGRTRAVRALRDLISSHKPAIIGLCETKTRSKRWDSLRVQLGFQNCFSSNCVGSSGGLAILWNAEMDVTVQSFSRYHIDVVVKGDKIFRLTLFYGNPRTELRKYSWELMRRLKGDRGLPWMMFGDFNEVMYSDETYGERERGQAQMREFRDVLAECELWDLGWKGTPFTFTNRRKGNQEMRARLDRAVANKEWMMDFPNASVTHGFANHSDHKPIIIDLDGEAKEKRSRKQKMFKFEPMWLRDPSFNQTVEHHWRSVSMVQGILFSKLRSCGEALSQWNKTSFGNVQHKVQALKKELIECREGVRTDESAMKKEIISDKLDE